VQQLDPGHAKTVGPSSRVRQLRAGLELDRGPRGVQATSTKPRSCSERRELPATRALSVCSLRLRSSRPAAQSATSVPTKRGPTMTPRSSSTTIKRGPRDVAAVEARPPPCPRSGRHRRGAWSPAVSCGLQRQPNRSDLRFGEDHARRAGNFVDPGAVPAAEHLGCHVRPATCPCASAANGR